MSRQAEIIERAELADIHAASTPEMTLQLGLQLMEIEGTLVSMGARLPASAIVINRALVSGPLDRAALTQIVKTYNSAEVGRWFLQLLPDEQHPDFHAWLTEAGLEKSRGWQKFVRGREPAPKLETDLLVREIGAEYGESFARISCAAFDLGDAAIPWMTKLPGRGNWHFFMSFDGDQPAGVGALLVRGKVAWMDFGATAPAFRKRGSQAAVLAARIDKALQLGCDFMYTCTGVAVDGDPQHSYKNILRAGFKTDYVRDNYEPA